MDKRFVLANRFIARSWSLENHRLRTESLESRMAKKTAVVSDRGISLEFKELGILDGNDFKVGSIKADKKTLEFKLLGIKNPLEIRTRYVLNPGDHFLRKYAEIKNVGKKEVTLLRTNLEPLTFLDEKPTYPYEAAIVGQLADPDSPSPLYETGCPAATENFFFGIEFPAAYNYFDKGKELHLDTYPGVTIAPGATFRPYPAVTGTGKKGWLKEAFDLYLRTLRPVKRDRLTVRIDVWMNLEPTYEEAIHLLDFLKRKMKKEHGFMPDTYGLSWMCGLRHPGSYRLDGYFLPKDKSIHERTAKEVQKAGMGYYIYYNPTGFMWGEQRKSINYYIPDNPDAPLDVQQDTREWGKRMGLHFATNPHGDKPMGYCLGQKKYRDIVRNRILKDTEKYNLREIVFDMFFDYSGLDCRERGHEHLPSKGGRYGSYGAIEAMMKIALDARKINPDLCIDGMASHLTGSPGWLMFMDSVHPPGSGGDNDIDRRFYAPRVRASAIAARDVCMYQQRVAKSCWMPMWGQDNFMGLQVRREFIEYNVLPVGEDISECWEDELVTGIAGHYCHSHINGVDFRILDETESGLGFYADVMKWAKANRSWLMDTKVVGGDPLKGEIIGYAHRSKNGTILTLRNNSMRDQDYKTPLSVDVCPWANPGEPLRAIMIYPTRYDFPDDLKVGRTPAVRVGAMETVVLIIRPSAAFDGPFYPGMFRDEDEKLIFAPQPRVKPTWRIKNLSRSKRITEGIFRINIPSTSARSELQLYFQPKNEDSPLYIEVEREEGPIEVKRQFRRLPFGKDAMDKHIWARVPLPPGRSTIHWRTPLELPEGGISKTAAWLECYLKLKGKKMSRGPVKEKNAFPVLYSGWQRSFQKLLSPSPSDP